MDLFICVCGVCTYRRNTITARAALSLVLFINIWTGFLWRIGSSPSLPCCADDQLHSVTKHIYSFIEWSIFTFLLHRLHTIHSFDLGLLLFRLELQGQWKFVSIWISSRLTLILIYISWALSFSLVSLVMYLYKHIKFSLNFTCLVCFLPMFMFSVIE